MIIQDFENGKCLIDANTLDSSTRHIFKNQNASHFPRHQKKKKNSKVKQWWHMPLIPFLSRQRQVDLYELKASLVYRRSCYRAATATGSTKKLCLNKQTDK